MHGRKNIKLQAILFKIFDCFSQTVQASHGCFFPYTLLISNHPAICCFLFWKLYSILSKKLDISLKSRIRKWKANWIGHILSRNCLLKQVIEGKIKGEMEVTRRRGRRRKKLLDDLKDSRGYCHLKEEALDRAMWRNRFGGGFEPVVRQNTEWMNEYVNNRSNSNKAYKYFSRLTLTHTPLYTPECWTLATVRQISVQRV